MRPSTHVLGLTIALAGLSPLTATASSTHPCIAAEFSMNSDATDLTGNGNNGSIHGPTSTSDRGSAASSAYAFDGVDDQVTITKTSTLLAGSGDFTVEVWVRVDPSGSGGPVIFDYSGLPMYGIDIRSDLTAQFTFRPGSSLGGGCCDPLTSVIGTTVLNDGAWHHIVGTRTGGTANLYVDGLLEVSDTNTGANGYINNNLCSYTRIGAAYSGGGHCGASVVGSGSFFTGDIDDVRFYNCLLDDTEVATLYTASPSSAAGAPVGTVPALPPIGLLAMSSLLLVTGALGIRREHDAER